MENENEENIDASDILGGIGETEGQTPETPEGDSGVVEIVHQPAGGAGIDYEKLGASFASALAPSLKASQPQAREEAPKQYTPEELDKMLNRFNPTPEFLAKFGNMDTQGAALVEFREAVVKQAATVAQIILQNKMAELERSWNERIGPVEKGWQQQQSERATADFNKTFPQLADPRLATMRDAVANQLGATWDKTKPIGEFYKAVAKGMEAAIRATPGNERFSLAASAAGAKTKPNNKSATNSPGYGGGGGNPGRGTQQPSHAASILGGVPVGR